MLRFRFALNISRNSIDGESFGVSTLSAFSGFSTLANSLKS